MGMSTRDAHNAMERERRVGLRSSFDRLRVEIPRIQASRAPSLQVLQEAATYIKDLREEDARMQSEISQLRLANTALRDRMQLPGSEAGPAAQLSATCASASSTSSAAGAPLSPSAVIAAASAHAAQQSARATSLLPSALELLGHLHSEGMERSHFGHADPLLGTAQSTTTLSSIEKFLAGES